MKKKLFLLFLVFFFMSQGIALCGRIKLSNSSYIYLGMSIENVKEKCGEPLEKYYTISRLDGKKIPGYETWIYCSFFGDNPVVVVFESFVVKKLWVEKNYVCDDKNFYKNINKILSSH